LGGSEALVLLIYLTASLLTSDQSIGKNDFFQLLNNLESVFNFLVNLDNDSHSNTRFRKVLFDIKVVNERCKIDDFIGVLFARTYRNKMAAQYVNEIVENIINIPIETGFTRKLGLDSSSTNIS